MRWAIAVLAVTAVFAGCSGGDGKAIAVQAPDDPLGAYVFTARVAADEWRWSFGDDRPQAFGKTVEHSFGVASGTFNVRLTAIKDGQKTEHVHQLVIGTGANAPGTFILDVGTAWAVTGEAVRFSAAASTDPEGDPILASWLCNHRGALQLGGGHDHGSGGGGEPYAPGQQSRLTVRVANATMPPPDRIVEGGFCDNVRSADNAFTEDATVEGTFGTPGVYRITLLAKDPANRFVDGFFDLVVSEPEARPAASFAHAFEGTFPVGAGGSGQQAADPLQQGIVVDRETHGFALELPALSMNVTFSHSDGAANQASWTLRRGSTDVAGGQGPGTVTLAAADLAAGSYTVEVTLRQGAQVSYEVAIDGTYNLDPSLKYDLGHH